MRAPLALYFVLGLAALASGCRREAPAPADTPGPPAIPFRLDGTLRFLRADSTAITGIAIEIADDDSSRTRGLMERDSIPAQVGMLFIMPRTEVQSFWMANTPRSLDIFYVGEDRRIVSIVKYTTPYSTESRLSEGPARFVVETVAGFADQHGIVPGDMVMWQRNDASAYVGTPPAPPLPAASTAPRTDSTASP